MTRLTTTGSMVNYLYMENMPVLMIPSSELALSAKRNVHKISYFVHKLFGLFQHCVPLGQIMGFGI